MKLLYRMANWMKDRAAEEYVQRVEMARDACRYSLICVRRAASVGWGWGVGGPALFSHIFVGVGGGGGGGGGGAPAAVGA